MPVLELGLALLRSERSAGWRLGAIWAPLNSALKGEFLRHQIEV